MTTRQAVAYTVALIRPCVLLALIYFAAAPAAMNYRLGEIHRLW